MKYLIILLLFVYDYCNAQQFRNNAKIITNINVTLGSASNLVLIGDSNGFGLNASPITNNFFTKLRDAEFSTGTNGSISGGSLLSMLNQLYSGTLVSYNISNSLLLTGGIGFNDMRWKNDSIKTQIKFGHAFTNYFIRHYGVFTSSRSVTRTGVHINHNLATYGFFANYSDYTNTSGCTWEYTHSGTNIGVVLFGNDGSFVNPWDYCEIYIDNVLVDTHNWLDQTDDIYPVGNSPAIAIPYIYRNLTNASHTIKILSKSTNICFVGGFFYLDESVTTPVLFQGLQYLSDFGYTQGDAHYGSRRGTDVLNRIIRNKTLLFKSWGFNVGYYDPNTYYIIPQGLDTDGIHYNNTGHQLIAFGLENVIR